MSYIVLGIMIVGILLFVGREKVGDIRNPHKGQVNEETSWKDIPKVKTRNMYSYYER